MSTHPKYYMRIPRLVTVTLFICYYRPDYPSILNDFTWQLDDRVPGFPRVRHFLEHWRTEIRAPISTVSVCASDGRGGWNVVEDVWHYR